MPQVIERGGQRTGAAQRAPQRDDFLQARAGVAEPAQARVGHAEVLQGVGQGVSVAVLTVQVERLLQIFHRRC